MTRQHTRWGLWVLALAVAAGFCGLGRWQLQRMHYKQQVLEQASHVREQLLPLPQALASGGGRLAWVQGRGRWLPGLVLLDNQIREGRAGLRIYQPLQVPGSGHSVLVDLGWVAWPPRRQLPVLAPLAGEATVRGLLASPPAAGLALGRPMLHAAAPDSWLATRIEPAAVATALQRRDISPQVLRLDPALPLGYPRDLEMLPNTLPPARHLAYAVQWFGLALAVLACAAALEWRRRRVPGQAANRRA